MKEPLLFPASLTIRSLFPPVLSQGAPSCAPAGGRAGLSESPGIWISPLAVGWDLSSFKHLLAFWGGCTCKCPGWLWMLPAALPGNRMWDNPFGVSLPLCPTEHSFSPVQEAPEPFHLPTVFSAFFLPPFLPILPFFWMFQVFPCSLNSGS